MWHSHSPIESDTLAAFEAAFDFKIKGPLRDFLLTHNGAKTRQHIIPTVAKERRVSGILDFSEKGNAWDINRRMRRILGDKCIVIGTDRQENFLCVRRNFGNQELFVWNHISGTMDDCTMDTKMLLMHWYGDGRSQSTSVSSPETLAGHTV